MTSPSDTADIREWNTWMLPIAARYPKNPDHPFCASHTYDALQCRLAEFCPEALAADQAAYALVADDFREKGQVPPPLERLAESASHLGASAADEACTRAALILGLPESLSDRWVWVSAKGTIMLLVPWEAWPDDEPPVDAWELSDRASDDAGAAPAELAIPTPGAFDDIDSDLRPMRPIQLHTLVERVMDLHKAGYQAPNPLVPLIREVPLEVAPSLSTERRILPAMPLRGSTRNSLPSQGVLFPPEGVAAKEVPASFLPGFRLADPNKSPLLELWDLGAVRQCEEGRKSKGGHVVPIVQRIFIEALLAVPWEARGELLVEYAVRLDQFLQWIWPNKRPSRGRYIEAIEGAAAYLDTFRPFVVGNDNDLGGRDRIVDFGRLPTWTRRPSEEEVRIHVRLPPGSQQGPRVSDRLRHYSVNSAACWRVLLTVPFLWDDPGRTLVPAGPGGPWVRTRQKKKYQVLSNEDLVKLVLPVTRNEAPIRQVALPRAIKHLEQLRDDGELLFVGNNDQWQILPPEFLEWERQ